MDARLPRFDRQNDQPADDGGGGNRLRGKEHGFDPPVGEKADACGGQESQSETDDEPQMRVRPHGGQAQRVPCRITAAPLQRLQRGLFLPCAGEQPADFVPFKDDDGENGAELNRDFGVGGRIAGESQCVAHENQMSG